MQAFTPLREYVSPYRCNRDRTIRGWKERSGSSTSPIDLAVHEYHLTRVHIHILMNNEFFKSGAVSDHPELEQQVGFVPSNQTSLQPGDSASESQGPSGVRTAKLSPNLGNAAGAVAEHSGSVLSTEHGHPYLSDHFQCLPPSLHLSTRLVPVSTSNSTNEEGS